MRERYWNMYCKLKHKDCYFFRLNIHCYRISTAISAITAIFSAGSVAAWWFWSNVPLLWGIIIMAMQVLQICKPFFPYDKQLVSLSFLNPRLGDLILRIDSDWLKIQLNNYTDESIVKMIDKHENCYHELIKQFVGNTYFPINGTCDKKAESDCKGYFYTNYKV